MTSERKLSVAMLVLAISVLVVSEPAIDIQMDVTKANPGEDVVVMCVVTDLGGNTISMSKSFKEVGDVPAYTDRLFVNKILLPAPKGTKRYTLDIIPVGNTGKMFYKLTITNVTAADSGPYTCSIVDLDLYAVKEFFVYNPIQEIKFQNITVDHSYSVIVANESTPLDVECMASGSIPAPDVRVFIGEEDITGYFRKTTSLTRHCAQGSVEEKKCLTYDTYNTNAFMPNFQPTYKHHNKELRCIAMVTESDFEPRRAMFKVHMQFGPKFDCHSVILGRLYEEEYKVKCNIMSNPGNPDFAWEFMWGGKKQSLTNNQATADGELMAGQTPKDNGNMEVWLKIQKISMRHFTMFTLNSNNSLGSNTMTIELKQDNTKNAARRTVATSMGLLLVLLRVLL